jgi:Peptidase inhibitor I9
MRFRSRLLALIAAAGLIPLGLSGTAAAAQASTRIVKAEQSLLTAAQVRQLAANATDHSIIVFKNQFPNLPLRGTTMRQRVSAVNAVQAPVLAELAKLHAKNVQGFQIINAIAATISSAEIQRLRANPAIQAVEPDTLQHLTAQSSGTADDTAVASDAAATDHSAATDDAVVADHDVAAQQVCPSNPAHPLIEPESRTLMNADAADQIANGSGIKVGLIYDGIDTDNPDLIRPDGQHVISDYQDFSGDGPASPTSGFGLYFAGLIASQGNQTYDLSTYVNKAHSLPAGCNIKIEGLAPGASVAMMDAFGDDAAVYNSSIIQAIQYAVTVEHVNVLDEPYGGAPVPNTQNDPSALADQAAVAAGVVVVSDTGDNGDTDSNINSPGGVPGVIGVGATTALQSYRQTDANGPNLGTSGWEDNNISADSTTGINEYGPSTMDVVAPGDTVWGLCSTDTKTFFACTDPDNGSSPGITELTSSGVSATEVTAVAAQVDQAYAKTHNGALPSPALVEQIIVSTATDLGAPADHQGAGLVNALKAVQLAESVNSSSRQGSTLLVNQTGLNATVDAHQSHTFSIGVTNEGSASQTVAPTVSGNPTTVSSNTGSVSLSSSSPTYVDGGGNTDSYAVHKFSVPSGTGYLNGDITWNAQKVAGAAYEELFDPQGKLAAYSVLDGAQSGFGHVEVSHPMAGTWTAVIYTVSNAKYFGTVNYSYSTEDFHIAGSVSPRSQTLAPGESGTFQVTVTAGQAGDEAFSLHVGTGSSTDGAIPVVLRALVPISGSGGSFAGTITGDGSPGGSTAAGGQEVTYQFNVPAGEPSLDLGVKLRDADYELEGTLVAPDGQPLDLQSTANDANAPGVTMQFFQRTPAPGLWTVSLITFAAVDGTHLSEPFTGAISFTQPAVTSKGLPDSASTVLTGGQPATATITVTNTGNIAKDYFADPRLNGQAQLTVLGTTVVGGSSYTDTQLSVAEPLSGSVNPHWLIPTDTSKLTITADSTLPITFDINSDNNDPEELGVPSGDNSVATATATELAPGQEWAAPEPTGPFSAAVSGTTKMVAVATANPFDSAITSSTGDAWQLTVNASAPYTPLTLAPGQSGTITITITPTAAKGTVVSGFIAVDTYNKATNSGDEIINIPYTYTVG